MKVEKRRAGRRKRMRIRREGRMREMGGRKEVGKRKEYRKWEGNKGNRKGKERRGRCWGREKSKMRKEE